MKKSISLLVNLLLSSTLFWGVPVAGGDEGVFKAPADTSTYCHMKFPPLRKDTLTWDQPVLDGSAGNIIDFYGPCDHDPMGQDEINVQRRALLRDYGDGE